MVLSRTVVGLRAIFNWNFHRFRTRSILSTWSAQKEIADAKGKNGSKILLWKGIRFSEKRDLVAHSVGAPTSGLSIYSRSTSPICLALHLRSSICSKGTRSIKTWCLSWLVPTVSSGKRYLGPETPRTTKWSELRVSESSSRSGSLTP